MRKTRGSCWKAAVAMLLIAVAAGGCAASSGSQATTGPKVVATVGNPTPVPTEPPDPTVGPTWTPTPTPVPPPLTLSDFVLDVTINGDQKQWTQDPSQSQPVNALYATRQDTATFIVTNTGDATRERLKIIYELSTPMTTVVNGQTYTSTTTDVKTCEIGTLAQGDYRQISIQPSLYSAMLTANLTIRATWDGGSLDLYAATLDPTFASGSYTPSNTVSVKKYGSAS